MGVPGMLRRPFLLSRSRGASILYRATRNVSSAPPLIRIQNGTFYRSYPSQESQEPNPPLFPNFNFVLPSKPDAAEGSEKKELQHWAVIGSTGRTALLDVLRGQYISIPPNARSYPYLSTDEIAAKDPRLRYPGNAIQYVGFSGEGSQATGGTRGAYLSARYESLREDTDWTVRQYLKGQTSLNPLEGEEEGKVHDEAFLREVVASLKLEELLDMPVANLSNGQTRRARIAKALLNKPELLLLDEPFMGLDPATVNSISTLLRGLAEKSAPRLVLALRPQDKVPDWITHLMVLGNGHRVLFQGSRSQAEKVFQVWKHLGKQNLHAPKSWPEDQKVMFQSAKKDLENGLIDRNLLVDMGLLEERTSGLEIHAAMDGEPIIEMDGVQVRYGDKTVLGGWKQRVNDELKEGLHWRVRRGQRWAILGANGSGKTTLLSLITSDHPQAYALPIRLFGRSRLPEPGKPAISVFDLQSRIGHSSPEVHAFFPRQLTVRQAIESAWAETFLSKPVLNHERDLDVDRVLRIFKPDLDPNFTAGTAGTAGSPSQGTGKGTNGGEKGDKSEAFDLLSPFEASGRSLDTAKLPDDEVSYADSLRFGSLSLPQQRLVLFLRAIIHKPDLVILDEAFSGMSPSLREKCFHLLEGGDQRRLKRFDVDDSLFSGKEGRFTGLTDEQALIVVSHVKEEVPGCVRHWMRLPSDNDGVGEPLEFKMGVLRANDSLNLNSELWDHIWSSNKMRKTRRRPSSKTKEYPGDEIVYNYVLPYAPSSRKSD
ncbi:ABC transporter [Rasamsonia emersonii CBS 393.64]|uniref:ABC transporter n=1 Tax=Rasamsonia emersonii (strain ATCC 16479 / CBS 393.64 / IMI 116815) TaxID=1408163 RepID=A0A0F4YKC8_RASE3|nr:ABC transporter [Rasamsonia emersonii CBS 393.64]KKA18316.1 ABC transporter [Rasamsonia emersonii CBS 393.64]